MMGLLGDLLRLPDDLAVVHDPPPVSASECLAVIQLVSASLKELVG